MTDTPAPPSSITQDSSPRDDIAASITDKVLGSFNSDGLESLIENGVKIIPHAGGAISGMLDKNDIVKNGLKQSGAADTLDATGNALKNHAKPLLQFILDPLVNGYQWAITKLSDIGVPEGMLKLLPYAESTLASTTIKEEAEATTKPEKPQPTAPAETNTIDPPLDTPNASKPTLEKGRQKS